MNPTTWPDTLLVESDLDAMVVTLGPSRRLVARGGLVGAAGSAMAGLGLVVSGQPVPGALIAVVGFTLSGVARIRGWVRQEAPLQIWVRPHGLELRRVFRGRLLHTEHLPYGTLAGCSATASGLRFRTRDGGVRDVMAGFRSGEELAWVARVVDGRVREAGEPSAVDPRLGALRTVS